MKGTVTNNGPGQVLQVKVAVQAQPAYTRKWRRLQEINASRQAWQLLNPVVVTQDSKRMRYQARGVISPAMSRRPFPVFANSRRILVAATSCSLASGKSTSPVNVMLLPNALLLA
jgi:hypothetical protein